MNFKKGCIVPNSELIIESFKVDDGYIIANLENENIESLINYFSSKTKENISMFFEIPLVEDETNAQPNSYKKGVYYLDGLSYDEVKELFKRYKDVFLEDGLLRFGLFSSALGDEIQIGKYNVCYVISNNLNDYETLLSSYNVKKVDSLVTAWDTFTSDSYGKSSLVTINNKTIYNVKNELEEIGLYQDGVIED